MTTGWTTDGPTLAGIACLALQVDQQSVMLSVKFLYSISVSSPLIDSIWTIMIVWNTRGKIIIYQISSVLSYASQLCIVMCIHIGAVL